MRHIKQRLRNCRRFYSKKTWIERGSEREILRKKKRKQIEKKEKCVSHSWREGGSLKQLIKRQLNEYIITKIPNGDRELKATPISCS